MSGRCACRARRTSDRSGVYASGTAVLLLLLATAVPASAQRMVSERFAAAPDGAVRVQNIAGSIKLMGWNRDSIAVSGTVHDTPSQRFEVYRGRDGVKLGLWDTSVGSVPPSHIEVRVPVGSRVWLRAGSSVVFVDGVSGSLDVHSVGGDIEVRGAPSEVFAESMTGRVTLDVGTRVARVKTVAGAILIQGTVTDVTATSVSGNILIDNAAVVRGRFETVGGDLRWVGAISGGAGLDFVTHDGAVEFLLPAATSAGVTVSSFEGSLRSEFAAPIRTSASKIKGSDQSFTLGDGGARVTVRTFRGRTVVRSR